LLGNLLVKHVIEGKTEVRGTRGRTCKQLPDEFKETVGILEIKRRRCRSSSVENSLSKRLWTCCKTVYMVVNEAMNTNAHARTHFLSLSLSLFVLSYRLNLDSDGIASEGQLVVRKETDIRITYLLTY